MVTEIDSPFAPKGDNAANETHVLTDRFCLRYPSPLQPAPQQLPREPLGITQDAGMDQSHVEPTFFLAVLLIILYKWDTLRVSMKKEFSGLKQTTQGGPKSHGHTPDRRPQNWFPQWPPHRSPTLAVLHTKDTIRDLDDVADPFP